MIDFVNLLINERLKRLSFYDIFCKLDNDFFKFLIKIFKDFFFFDPPSLSSTGETLALTRWLLRVLTLQNEIKGAGLNICLTSSLDIENKGFYIKPVLNEREYDCS